jgi:Pyridine nucleotide-disulphide oxidoreductase
MSSDEEFLNHFRPNGFERVFVVGTFDRRLTVVAQQSRAINLVDALFRTGKLRRENHCVVVGAGAAGITAAAAAASRGARVTVFEKSDRVLSRFDTNHTRWLHPHLYEWPAREWDSNDAGLPLLNWRGDTARNVALNLKEQWSDLRMKLRIREHFHVKVTGLREAHGMGPEVLRTGTDGPLSADAVIVAVGFGLEGSGPTGSHRYWENDNLEGVAARADGTPSRVLILGNGDGAVVDLLRVRLRDFSHRGFFAELFRDLRLEYLQPKLFEIEQRVNAARYDPKASWKFLTDEYLALPADALDGPLAAKLRPGTQVIITGLEAGAPINPNAFLLNRLLLSRFVKHGSAWGFSYAAQRLEVAELPQAISETWSIDHGIGEVHRVVLRTGPERTGRPIHELFAADSAACIWLDAVNKDDATRAPRWSGREWPAPWGEEKELDDLCSAIADAPDLVQVIAILLRYHHQCRERAYAEHKQVYQRFRTIRATAHRTLKGFSERLEPAQAARVAAFVREHGASREVHLSVVAQAVAEALDDRYRARFFDIMRSAPTTELRPLEAFFSTLEQRRRTATKPPAENVSSSGALAIAEQVENVVMEFHPYLLLDLALHQMAVLTPGRVEDYLWDRPQDRSLYFHGARLKAASSTMELVREAQAYDASIIVLPELSFDEGDFTAFEKAAPHSAVLVAGSYHCQRDNSRRHITQSWIASCAREQGKLCIGEYYVEAAVITESIALAEPRPLVMHVGRGGTMSIVLGSDLHALFAQNVGNHHREKAPIRAMRRSLAAVLRPRLVVVPSIAQPSALRQIASHLASELDGLVVLAEASSGVDPAPMRFFQSIHGVVREEPGVERAPKVFLHRY